MIRQEQRHPRRGQHDLGLMMRASVALTAMWLVCVIAQPATAASPDEYTLKVAYLYNFTRYITWPDDAWATAEQDFVIGVIGANPFGTTLDQLAEKRLAQQRPIAIRCFETLADYKPCHMLFVPASTPQDVRAAVIRQTRNQPILVVGESFGYAQEGATVNFMGLLDGTIKIEINIDAMNQRRMQTNALLLKLATVVRERGAE